MLSETPFGGMPLLEIDGNLFCQSGAIDRCLARKFSEYNYQDSPVYPRTDLFLLHVDNQTLTTTNNKPAAFSNVHYIVTLSIAISANFVHYNAMKKYTNLSGMMINGGLS